MGPAWKQTCSVTAGWPQLSFSNIRCPKFLNSCVMRPQIEQCIAPAYSGKVAADVRMRTQESSLLAGFPPPYVGGYCGKRDFFDGPGVGLRVVRACLLVLCPFVADLAVGADEGLAVFRN